MVYIDAGNTVIKELSVADVKGTVVLKKTNLQKNSEMDLSAQPPGTYIITIQTTGQIVTGKIVKY
jgi:hypothetical protein